MPTLNRRRNVSYAKWGYIFSIPFVAAFAAFMIYPLVYTVFIGFTNLQGAFMPPSEAKILDDPFANFKTVLSARTFRTAFSNTWKIWMINFIPQIVLALVLTAWFTNRRHKIKGQGLFKVLFYLPNIITAASIAILFSALFMAPIGPVNWALQAWGITDAPIFFTMSKSASQYIVAFIQFWMWYGYTMLVLISGVLGLNPEMYEVSEIDGANGIQQFFFITLPNLRTILLYTLVTSLVGGLGMFDVPRLFNNGGPDQGTLTLSLYVYGQAFSGMYFYNRASAASMIIFVITAVLSAIIFYLLRDAYEAREKKLARRARREARRAARLARIGGVSA